MPPNVLDVDRTGNKVVAPSLYLMSRFGKDEVSLADLEQPLQQTETETPSELRSDTAASNMSKTKKKKKKGKKKNQPALSPVQPNSLTSDNDSSVADLVSEPIDN
ncbi:hypothetical protein HDU76_001325, partial [Blyttiomyces sp. JEL0837]